MAETLGVPMDVAISDLIQLPGVMSPEDTDQEPDEAWKPLSAAVDEALSHVLDMRKKEGSNLAGDFVKRLDYLSSLRTELLEYSSGVAETYRQRLSARVAELTEKQPVDESRIAQEVAMFADKASVDEELVRLESHFAQFLDLLDSNQPVGRKLDFLCQEILRETNTIGSKANELSMTKIVVEMKSELEKLREQVQNVQ
jgi:uncharacterized protein (TIGR00255 family)